MRAVMSNLYTDEQRDTLLVFSSMNAYVMPLRAGTESSRTRIAALVLSLIALCASPGLAYAQLRGHGGPVRALAISRDGTQALSGSFVNDGRMVSSGEDPRIAVWNRGESEPSLVLAGHNAPVAALGIAPDGASLASASWDHTVRLWPLARTGNPRVFEGHTQGVNGVAFSPDGTALITAGYDATLRIWPLLRDAPAVATALPAPLNTVVVAPDGEIITAGADGKIYLLSAAGKISDEIQAGASPIISAALSPDGRLIAAASIRGSVAIIERRSRVLVRTLVGPGLPVWSVAFFPDSRTLLSGGTDRVIRRWNTQSGEQVGDAVAGAPGDPLAAFAGDPGAELFRACVACHTLRADEGPRAGPTLAGVFGRRIATLPGYNFSAALKKLDTIWTPATVSKLFELGPMAYTPGTKMPEQRIGSAEDRAALVRFLERATSQN